MTEKLLSQEQFDEALNNRLSRERDKFEKKLEKLEAKIDTARKEGRSEILDELNVDTPEELKATLEKMQEGQSETAKLNRELAKLKKERDTAVEELSTLQSKKKNGDIDAAILEMAGDKTYAKSVLAHMRMRGNLDIDSDGNVTADGQSLEKQFKQLLVEHPELQKGDLDRGGAGSDETVTTPNVPVNQPADTRSFPAVQQAAAAQGVTKLYPWEPDPQG